MENLSFEMGVIHTFHFYDTYILLRASVSTVLCSVLQEFNSVHLISTAGLQVIFPNKLLSVLKYRRFMIQFHISIFQKHKEPGR